MSAAVGGDLGGVEQVALTVVGLLALALLVRTMRVALWFDDDGITYRGFVRTQTIPWEEVKGARVEAGDQFRLGLIVVIDRRSGRPLRSEGLSALGAGKPAEDHPATVMAAAINARL